MGDLSICGIMTNDNIVIGPITRKMTTYFTQMIQINNGL
jgi:hypothetical protein